MECLATGKNDQILEDSILRLYEFAMSYPYPEKWLEECLSSLFRCRTMEEFEQCRVASGVASIPPGNSSEISRNCWRRLCSICKENQEDPYLYEPAILSDLENLEKLQGSEASYRELYTAIHSMEKWARLSSKKDETIQENKKNQVKAIREEVKTEIKALQEELFCRDSGNRI